MEAWTEIARAITLTGEELALRARGGVYEIRCNGWDLMSSRAHASEEEMARITVEAIGHRSAPEILVGGLGMGFTLRAALDAAPADAIVTVAELMPEIVAWNAGPLAHLARRPLDDGRVSVHIGDVMEALRHRPGAFDAILLDTDNGPGAVMLARNARLYARDGLALARGALKGGGVLALWSADRSEAFEALLGEIGIAWRVVETAAAPGRAPRHAIYLLA